MHVGDGLDRVVETVAAPAAVAEDLVVLQPADDMFHADTNPAVLGVVVFLSLQQRAPGALAVRHGHTSPGRAPGSLS